MFLCGPAGNQLCQDEIISIRDGSPNWWVSDDIILSGPIVKRMNNPVKIRARKDERKSWPGGVSTDVRFELYVSNPSLNSPTPGSSDAPQIESTKERNITRFSTSNPGGSMFESTVDVTFDWMADESVLNPRAGEDPNNLHRCLIARCYRADLSPMASFNVVEDPHVAQRNLIITPVSRLSGMLSFPIETSARSLEITEAATIRAFADRVPSAAVLEAILPSLKQFKGFRQLAGQIAPARFALQVPENLSPVIRDNSRLEKMTPINPGDIPFRDKWRFVFRDGFNFGRFRDSVFNPSVVLQNAVVNRKFNAPLNVRSLQVSPELRIVPRLNITQGLEKLVEQAAPTFEADIKLPPKEVANFTFTANLPENSQLGDAHIFHVMHINDQKQVIGGLTIVAVVE